MWIYLTKQKWKLAPNILECWRLRVKWHKDKTHTRQTPLWPEGKELRKQASWRFTLISPPWAEFQTAWPSLFSIAHVLKCYCTAKGSEISAYCRVCPEPFLSSYHKKGMFPRLQGTIKLKAVSRLLGRMPRLQARSAWAESPVRRHISTFPIVAALTLHRETLFNFLLKINMIILGSEASRSSE